MKNEVGVPLSIRKICEVWIGFFPIKICSGNFSTDLDFLWQLPFDISHGGLGIFSKGETFSKNKHEREWERPERKAECGGIIVNV